MGTSKDFNFLMFPYIRRKKIIKFGCLLIIIVLLCACSNKQTKIIIDDVTENKTHPVIDDVYETVNETNILNIQKVLYVNSKEGLRVRIQPSTNSDIICTLKDKEPVYVIKKNENVDKIDNLINYWYYVQKGNMQGWVFGAYLVNELTDDEAEEDNDITGKYTYISFDIITQEYIFIFDYYNQLKDLYIEIEKISEGYYKIKYYDFVPYFSEMTYKFDYPLKYKDYWYPDFTSKYEDPLICKIDGEKGGGGRYTYFYYKDKQLKINYLYFQAIGNFMEDPDGPGDPNDVYVERLEFNAVLKKM